MPRLRQIETLISQLQNNDGDEDVKKIIRYARDWPKDEITSNEKELLLAALESVRVFKPESAAKKGAITDSPHLKNIAKVLESLYQVKIQPIVDLTSVQGRIIKAEKTLHSYRTFLREDDQKKPAAKSNAIHRFFAAAAGVFAGFVLGATMGAVVGAVHGAMTLGAGDPTGFGAAFGAFVGLIGGAVAGWAKGAYEGGKKPMRWLKRIRAPMLIYFIRPKVYAMI